MQYYTRQLFRVCLSFFLQALSSFFHFPESSHRFLLALVSKPIKTTPGSSGPDLRFLNNREANPMLLSGTRWGTVFLLSVGLRDKVPRRTVLTVPLPLGPRILSSSVLSGAVLSSSQRLYRPGYFRSLRLLAAMHSRTQRFTRFQGRTSVATSFSALRSFYETCDMGPFR